MLGRLAKRREESIYNNSHTLETARGLKVRQIDNDTEHKLFQRSCLPYKIKNDNPRFRNPETEFVRYKAQDEHWHLRLISIFLQWCGDIYYTKHINRDQINCMSLAKKTVKQHIYQQK